MDDNKAVVADTKAASSFSLTEFVRTTRRELAKVTWPSRRETVMTTTLIIVMALVTGVFFFAVDSGIGFVISRILGMKE
jgi:preprotein translocase subunit SecE